jgi:hypothetical protein
MGIGIRISPVVAHYKADFYLFHEADKWHCWNPIQKTNFGGLDASIRSNFYDAFKSVGKGRIFFYHG